MRRIFLLFIFLLVGFGCAKEVITQQEPPPKPYTGRFVYQEQDRISACFEVQNLEEFRNLIPSTFQMPSRPLCRVEVIDFCKMKAGPTYLESTVSILVTHENQLGWYCLTMPVTNEDSARGGRNAWGFPKVVRKITLERGENRYVGTSYDADGKTAELRLALEVKKTPLSSEEKGFLDFISPLPSFTLKADRVLTWSGSKYRIYEWEKVAPHIWEVKFGRGAVEFPKDPKNLLCRLNPGRFLVGYWYRQRHEYVLTPK